MVKVGATVGVGIIINKTVDRFTRAHRTEENLSRPWRHVQCVHKVIGAEERREITGAYTEGVQ